MKKYVIIISGCLLAGVLAVVPPQVSSSQNQVKERIENLENRAEKLDEKLSKLVEVDELPNPKTIQEKTNIVYKVKTKIKTVKVNRKVIMKVGNIYFETYPEIDGSGNYIIDLERIKTEKRNIWESLNLAD